MGINEEVKQDDKAVAEDYNWSYTAKIIQGDNKLKICYGKVKNCLLQYGLVNRISWNYETFKSGNKTLARLELRGKTLLLYLALDAGKYKGTEYKVTDVSGVAKNAEVPLLYEIITDKNCSSAKELISEMMKENGLEAGNVAPVDYVAEYRFEGTTALLQKGLVKVVKGKKSAKSDGEEALAEAVKEEAPAKKVVEVPVEKVVEAPAVVHEEPKKEQKKAEESVPAVKKEKAAPVKAVVQVGEARSDKTRKDIVNVGDLNKLFKAGEKVTVKEIVKRVPSVDSRATYIKVLARGVLDKALHIEADGFSSAATEKIALAGGSVIRTKS